MIEHRRKTILVIEDERPLVKVIETKLEKGGFDVVTARTVKQGLEYIDDIESIDAVWLDHYLLGEETGLDFVSTMKNRGGLYKKMPIFVVSNTASSTNVSEYLRLGVTEYSVKSNHRLEEITTNINKYIDNRREIDSTKI